MKLLRIDDAKNPSLRIFTPINEDKCELLIKLKDGIDNQYKQSCKGILIKLENISNNGLKIYNSDILHEASKEDKIYEITHGRLRLFYFVERNNMVCTDIHIKKRQHASKKEVNKAVKIRNKINEAISNNQLKIYVEDEDGTLQITSECY